jgi:hypothetical protein
MVLSFGVNEDDNHVSQFFKPLLPTSSIGRGEEQIGSPSSF